jgi:hypothetical protein
MSKKLGVRTAQEVLSRELMVEGVLSIQAGENPRIVEEKLKVFLPPVMRLLLEESKKKDRTRRREGGSSALGLGKGMTEHGEEIRRQEETISQSWLTTYGDMVTLLWTFFVVPLRLFRRLMYKIPENSSFPSREPSVCFPGARRHSRTIRFSRPMLEWTRRGPKTNSGHPRCGTSGPDTRSGGGAGG